MFNRIRRFYENNSFNSYKGFIEILQNKTKQKRILVSIPIKDSLKLNY